MKKTFVLLMIMIFITESLLSCSSAVSKESDNTDFNKQYYEACNSPFKKYPETINYTLGKMTGLNNSNMPSCDTYEDNAYTRYLKDKLNIQNSDAFEEIGTSYDNMLNMAISDNNIPDIMVVDNYSYLKLLVENDMIEDLTDVYQRCASDRIKDIYKSYDKEILDNVTFDGKLMALPETNIDNGPNMLWLRKDWIDKLGLPDPKNLADAEYIIKQFVEKDPGKNGKDNTIGLACSTDLSGEKGYNYIGQVDTIFACYNSFPRYWIKDSDNNVSYGSVLPEAKQALAHLNKLYKDGILDNQFLLREENNIQDMITDGKCGAFFGLWWSPNNPLMDSMKKNKDAKWVPYMIPTDNNGRVSFCSQNPSSKYIVVRKGYEHPELVMKECSVLFDYFTCNNSSVQEIKSYYEENVDPTARPFAVNIDYKDALTKGYRDITDVLEGKKHEESLNLLEYGYYEQCKRFVDNVSAENVEDWAAYTSRITASKLINDSKLNSVQTYFHNKRTKTMEKSWWKLEQLEREAYLKIITGEESIDYFDYFVDKWYKEGGEQITNEVRSELKGEGMGDIS